MRDAVKHPVRIILFTKYPQSGKVKTRLIPVLGPNGAAALQQKLLLKTMAALDAAAVQTGAEIEVRFDGGTRTRFSRMLGNKPRYVPQGEGDLGSRMEKSISDAFDGGISKVVLVGADIPYLSARIIMNAILALDTADVVIGPAIDGGYYLIALGQRIPELFREIPWSSSRVFELTTSRLHTAGFSYSLVDRLRDLDRPEDLAHFDFSVLAIPPKRSPDDQRSEEGP